MNRISLALALLCMHSGARCLSSAPLAIKPKTPTIFDS
jgi:hypothetical protein